MWLFIYDWMMTTMRDIKQQYHRSASNVSIRVSRAIGLIV